MMYTRQQGQKEKELCDLIFYLILFYFQLHDFLFQLLFLILHETWSHQGEKIMTK